MIPSEESCVVWYVVISAAGRTVPQCVLRVLLIHGHTSVFVH